MTDYNLSKIDQLFVSGLEAHIEMMKATPGEDGVTRQLEAQALLQTFKTLGATLILRVVHDALAASTGEQEQTIGLDSASVDWHLNQLVTSLGRARTITSNLSRRTASELQGIQAKWSSIL
jgi:hypothetical protein